MMALTDESVLTIYNWYVEGMPVRDIARHFNITEPYVYNLVKGKARPHLHQLYFPKKKGGDN